MKTITYEELALLRDLNELHERLGNIAAAAGRILEREKERINGNGNPNQATIRATSQKMPPLPGCIDG